MQLPSRTIPFLPKHKYAVAGYLIEKVSGMPYEAFIQQRILAPLHMEKSSLHPTDPYLKEHLAIDLGDEGPYRLVVDKPAAALFTSAQEMSGYLRMYLNQGMLDSTRIAQASTVERMFTPTSSLASKAGSKLGYGLGLIAEEWEGNKLFLHGGDQPFFTSLIIIIPALEQAFYVASNTNHSVFPIALAIMEALEPKQAQKKVATFTATEEETLIGFYRPINTAHNVGTSEFFISYLLSPIVLSQDEQGVTYTNYLDAQPKPINQERENLFYFTSRRGFKNWLFKGKNWEGEDVLVDTASGLTFKKSSAFAVWGSFTLSLLCVLFILSVPIITFFRLIWKYLFRKQLKFQWSLRLGLFAFLCFFMFNALLIALSPETANTVFDYWSSMNALGNVSAVSLSLFALSLLFGLSSFGALILAFRNVKSLRLGILKFYTVAVGLFLTFASAYLLNFGYIGIMPWN